MMDIYPLNLFELKKGVVLVYHALFRASCYPAKVAVDQYIILPGKVTFYFYFCNKHVFFFTTDNNGTLSYSTRENVCLFF